jgi:hypothetical protein
MLTDKNPEPLEIQFGVGLGNIKFGATIDEVEQLLGRPTEVEIMHPDKSVVGWYYNDHRLRIAFQKQRYRLPGGACDDFLRVMLLVTSHPDATLCGIKIIGQPENSVMKLLEESGYTGFHRKDAPAPPRYTDFHSDNLSVTLDFRDGLLRRVIWAPKGV